MLRFFDWNIIQDFRAAIMKLVRLKMLKGHNLARQRFANGARTGILSGQIISDQCLITSKSSRLSKPIISSTVNQFWWRWGVDSPHLTASRKGISHNLL
jgi:hypothetical protein